MSRKMSWSINHGSCKWFSWPFKIEWISFAGQFSARGMCGKETGVSTWTHFILKHQLLQSECIWLTLKNSVLWDLIQCKKLFIVHILKVDAHNPLLDALMSFLFLAAPRGMWDRISTPQRSNPCPALESGVLTTGHWGSPNRSNFSCKLPLFAVSMMCQPQCSGVDSCDLNLQVSLPSGECSGLSTLKEAWGKVTISRKALWPKALFIIPRNITKKKGEDENRKRACHPHRLFSKLCSMACLSQNIIWDEEICFN